MTRPPENVRISTADLKKYREELSAILKSLARRLDACCREFNTNRIENVAGAERVDATSREGTIFHWISEGLQGDLHENDIAELLRLRSVLAFIKGVQAPFEKLEACIGQKIERHVLFSDRAVREVNDLFRKSAFLMNACGDAVLTENPILKAHVLCGVGFVFKLLHNYAEDHERRLVEGVCTPRGSVCYLDMNASFRSMLHHVKEIAQHITVETEMETWACPPHANAEGGE